MDVKHWLPKNILEANRGNKSYAIAILNRKISLKPATFIKLWNGGKYLCHTALLFNNSSVYSKFRE